MLARKTVFVIGAGASHEFGLPLGLKLLHQIHKTATDASKVSHIGNNIFLTSILKSGIPNIDSDLQFKLAAFAGGLPTHNSIDRYLDFHWDNSEMVAIGKFAITYQILLSEQQSNMSLMEPMPEPLATVSDTYIRGLFSLMVEGTDRHTIADMFDNVSFICFNYDRCIEAYFYLAIKALLSCSAQQASEIFNNMEIYHPYGTVGKLFNSSPPRDNISDFLFATNASLPILCSGSWRGIRTFTENMDDQTTLNNMHKTISEAERIVFIGFSFLDQNMKLLKPPSKHIQAQEIMATNFGMSQSDIDIVTAYSRTHFISKDWQSIREYGLIPRFYNQTASQFISSESNYLRQ